MTNAERLYQAFKESNCEGTYRNPLDRMPAADAILEAAAEEQREVALLAFTDDSLEQLRYPKTRQHLELVRRLLKATIAFNESDLVTILSSSTCEYDRSILGSALQSAERFGKKNSIGDALSCCLRGVSQSVANDHSLDGKSVQRLRAKISKILGEEIEETIRVNAREPWAERLLGDVEQLEPQNRSAMTRVISHAGTASAGKPTKSWQKEAANRLAAVDTKLATSALTVWFDTFDEPATEPGNDYVNSVWSVSDQNADVMKGLLWTASQLTDEALIRAIGKAGQSGQRKIAGIGPRSNKVTNAAVWALGQIDHQLAISQLSILKSRIKNKSTQKQITKAMNAVAERIGVPPEEVEEMAVPTFGLTEVGKRVEQLGEFTAELVITGTKTTQLRWIKPDGKPQKTIPKAVKDDFADELKEIRAAAKDVQKLLPTQRERIDSLFLDQKEWSFANWSERYLEQPLVGVLARRIIWNFETAGHTTAGIWHDGQLIDAGGDSIKTNTEKTTVRLWHPIEAETSDILAWRDFLERNEITQPFKQAHREIYLLTDAERNTNIYSNRYAAHILKQHQFNALCGARRWRNSLRLMVDDEYPPASRELPQWELRAEFWVEGAGDEYGTDTNETGTYLYLTTDQVRFYPIHSNMNSAHAGGGGYGWARYRNEAEPEPIPVERIPPLVFSEIMRDVDLFVGVASVGNDPNWDDGGPEGRYRDYWASYSFGELSGTANTRKEILQRLVPRLKIASQCSFDDKFLVVEGTKRTYKIHLGSGNILMKPNDQYLCIVPKSSTVAKSTDKVFLPFEGDRTMSIILSKAFMLAEDTKIKDPTILSQIGR